MFIQIIQGQVRDEERVNSEASRWSTDLKPGAIGFLGSTWGVAADGTFFVASRFDSEESAKANSARPEQGEWWSAIEPALERVSFLDCSEVDEMMGGGSDDAGFVQVIQGRVNDQGSARTIMRSADDRLSEGRPDILGGLMAWHGTSGDFTQIMYFRSEEEARAGEGSPSDDEVDNEYRDMMANEPTFIDLTEPHFD